MYLFMPKEDLTTLSVVSKKEKQDKKGKKVVIPRRACRGCSDRKYCDLDFCLRWYH